MQVPSVGANQVLLRHATCGKGKHDDIEMSDIVHPPLTTLRLPRFELAKAFFDALEHLKNNPHAQGEQHNVKTTLVVRESTGPAPKRMLSVALIAKSAK